MQRKRLRVVEQVTHVDPGRCIRYRVIEGGPICFHNGEIRLLPTEAGCEVQWTVRCRSRYPFIGGLLGRYLQKMMDRMLYHGLRPYAEYSPGRMSAGEGERKLVSQ
jgi:hypothetical protein